MSNRKNGTTFERELCEALSEKGFWAHNLAQNSAGQPFDVIAAKNGKTYIIDCKVCKGEYFRFSRVEQNQRLAMTLWKETGNGEGWFALRLSDGSIYMMALKTIDMLIKIGKMSANLMLIDSHGIPFERWVKMCG